MAKQFALLLLLAGLAAATASSGTSGDVDHLSVPEPADPEDLHYFWNEVTGQVQWEDPGNTPFEDERGYRFWVNDKGQKIHEDPDAYKYVWVEQFSEELQRPYFYNQETRQSQWERPPDLSWRRIRVKAD